MALLTCPWVAVGGFNERTPFSVLVLQPDFVTLIRTGKDSGFGRLPSRLFANDAAWIQLALVRIDLLAWTRTLLLDGERAVAEPKKLRY